MYILIPYLTPGTDKKIIVILPCDISTNIFSFSFLFVLYLYISFFFSRPTYLPPFPLPHVLPPPPSPLLVDSSFI